MEKAQPAVCSLIKMSSTKSKTGHLLGFGGHNASLILKKYN